MKVGIIQSNYIPWRGYFDIIDDVDLFIFYDDVQYTKNDWRNRNRLKTGNGLMWLTVPVLFKFSDKTLIQDAKISYKNHWLKNHEKSILNSYSKASFFTSYAEDLFSILNNKYVTISELNVDIIKWIMQKLNIKTETIMSSAVTNVGIKTARLINILKEVGATSYLTGPSAKNYHDVEKFQEAGIGLEYKVYEYKEYPQLYGGFVPQVSVLDLLFNCGENSRKYLKSLRPNEKDLL
ncbi:MAG: WbqC family protein [Proteobacteria bacterium]|nr:WbqC family protein [Pseudomonadota bacterium]MBU4259399.1 WbqC family protein [Pseudomonadota bacterium]MBU4288192.1 WbqC family protein [Pseudomonadota bacterium]MBU4415092.1 WbqC family protein [Pseudomonadota bacterium]MCG2757757.1 WbqC family protein [Desulfobacteraceae bacterium]